MTATADDIRAQLAGYSPAAAKAAEAGDEHAKALKFAPPWYEAKHFRATLRIAGVYPNKNGIDGVVFNLEGAEHYDGTADSIHVPLPKTAPGYPTDELNLMVASAAEADPKIQHVADLDGLDIELELDYAEHPWMKERDREGNNIMPGGQPVARRCWYYKTVAIFGGTAAEAPTAPDPANVRKLAEWCVGKTPEECGKQQLLKATAAHVLNISGDSLLQKAIMDGSFLTAAVSGLVVGTDGKLELS